MSLKVFIEEALAEDPSVSDSALAERLGCTRQYVHAIRKRVGAPKASVSEVPSWVEEAKREGVLELVAAGKSFAEIERFLGMEEGSVSRRRQEDVEFAVALDAARAAAVEAWSVERECTKCGVVKAAEKFAGRMAQCRSCRADQVRAIRQARDNSEPLVASKVCSRCGEEKAAEEYHRDRKSADGLQTWCRICWNEWRREYRRSGGADG